MKIASLILNHWEIIYRLVINDIRNKYVGSYLGIIWAFIHPLVMTFVYWFVFTFGLKVGDIEEINFLPWLLCGLVPFFFINESIMTASDSVVSQSYLVKKVNFKVELLPIVKVISALLVNSFFIFLLFFICFLYGYFPNMYWLQLFYYYFCTVAIIMGISFSLSSLLVFVIDLRQLISITMQILFWATPIMWNISTLNSDIISYIIRLNPLVYIVNGVRNSLLFQRPFWMDSYETIYFWVLVLVFYKFGFSLFKRLRPYFADVL